MDPKQWGAGSSDVERKTKGAERTMTLRGGGGCLTHALLLLSCNAQPLQKAARTHVLLGDQKMPRKRYPGTKARNDELHQSSCTHMIPARQTKTPSSVHTKRTTKTQAHTRGHSSKAA